MEFQNIDQLIQQHYGFIIKTVSETTQRYVSTENDDAFSIALSAFQEACQRYDQEKGPFLNYVKIVIKSRVLDYLRKENRHKAASLDQLHEEGVQFATEETAHQKLLALEIQAWNETLNKFGIHLDQLVDVSPKHSDTRENAIEISERSSQHPPIVEPLFSKRRLPIKVTAEYNKVSKKVIQTHKHFIISVIIIFVEKYSLLLQWVRRG